ncbi:MAG: hypothetical protein ACKVQW_09285 [Pyrinomonadaceae bacterium]
MLLSRYIPRIIAGIVTIIVVATGVQFLRDSAESPVAILSSFDFGPLRGEENPGRGAQPGELIDIRHLTDKNGQNLADYSRADLTLLAVIDPECWATSTAVDHILDVERGAREIGVDYFLVSFTYDESSSRFWEVAQRISPNTIPFLWDQNERPPESLITMVVPSFLVVDRSGTILQTFPGTNVNADTRAKMASRTIEEVAKLKTNLANGSY